MLITFVVAFELLPYRGPPAVSPEVASGAMQDGVEASVDDAADAEPARHGADPGPGRDRSRGRCRHGRGGPQRARDRAARLGLGFGNDAL